jgi:hypothetical protein
MLCSTITRKAFAEDALIWSLDESASTSRIKNILRTGPVQHRCASQHVLFSRLYTVYCLQKIFAINTKVRYN